MATKFTLLLVGTVAAAAPFWQAAGSAELTPILVQTPQGQPRSDVGLNFLLDNLDLRGTLTTQRNDTSTLVTPRLASRLAVSSRFNLETRATFANWHAETGALGNALETKLVARAPLPMLNRIEGVIAHDADGTAHHKLGIQMAETVLPYLWSESIKLNASASIDHTRTEVAPAAIVTRVETALKQQSSVKAFNQIGLKYSSSTGALDHQQQAATFSRSWAQTDLFRLGVEYELIHEAGNLQRLARFTWKGYF